MESRLLQLCEGIGAAEAIKRLHGQGQWNPSVRIVVDLRLERCGVSSIFNEAS